MAATETPGKRIFLRAQQIQRGTAPLDRLPTPEELAKRTPEERHAFQEERRVELFAVSSLLAEACIARARRERPNYPPYGLVLSRHTELRMVVANPGPVEAGAITGFHALGKAFIDTTVWHLHGSFTELRAEGKGWLIDRLDDLLELFKVGASPASRARMRDPVSFVYGGLHFGTAVCVQLAEVMTALLEDEPGMDAEERAAVLSRSGLPAYHLASYGVSEVLRAYQRLQSTTRRTVAGGASQAWLDPQHFVLRQAEGRPSRIDLKDEDLLAGAPPPPTPGLHELTTLGCPARISPSGATSPIATLWSWGVELAHDTGLLGPVTPPETPPEPPDLTPG